MDVVDTALPGVLIVTPRIFADDRGSFSEVFNLAAFRDATGIDRDWVQDNESTSVRHVLRGIHYQHPRPQGKLVRCTLGEVFDVAVDLRRSSPTFLRWLGVRLSAVNRSQLWIPEGFGHGFLALSDKATVQYKTTEYFDATADRSIAWNDPAIGVAWPLSHDPILSDRDRAAPSADEAALFE